MEAAAVACRGGLLVRARPGRKARERSAWDHGVGVLSRPYRARRRLLVASVRAGEALPAHSGAVALEVDGDADSAEILPPPDAPAANTVRVKFVLKKQCAFGQQFLVVGDDPALGLWNPASGIALDWSEDHVWTAKTDLPANKFVEFKFLLREASGHVRWQHGANRTLQTTETTNTLVVYEDWDHAENQKVSEEDELSIGAQNVMFLDDLEGSDGVILEDNLQTDEIHENVETDRSAAAAVDASLHGGMTVANETNQQQDQLMVDKKQTIPEEIHGEAKIAPQNGTPSADYYAGRNDDDTLCQEGAPAHRPTSIFENDLAWAGKAMQQLLRTLGFQIGTTKT